MKINEEIEINERINKYMEIKGKKEKNIFKELTIISNMNKNIKEMKKINNDNIKSIKIKYIKNNLEYNEYYINDISKEKKIDLNNENENNIILNEKYEIKGTIFCDGDTRLYNNCEKFDVYINDIKTNLIKNGNVWKINKTKGVYKFRIILNNNINNLEDFFGDNTNIISIDLSNFNSSNITNINKMFLSCGKLKEIKGLNKFNTSNVKNKELMFQYCYELEFLDLYNFNTSNATNMNQMLYGCNKLEYLDLSNFNLNNATNLSNMFSKSKRNKRIE